MKILKLILAALVSATFMTQPSFAGSPMDVFKQSKDYLFGWTPKVLDVLSLGNAKNGQAIAKKQKCAKCHGDTGISDEDDTPSIAGQAAPYIYKQLADYKSRARKDKSMKKVTKKLSLKDMADLGAFYAVQKPEKKTGGKVPPLVDKGDRSRLLLACNDCHNEKKSFRSMMEIPATLEGQKPEYFLDTLTAFKEADRSNDLFGRMRFIASRLTDEEIEELAKYYSTKPLEE